MTVTADAVVLSDNAQSTLESLEQSSSSRSASIAKRARQYRSVLFKDCLHGEVVRKSAIPASLRSEFGIENLYVEDLPDFWRMLYSIVKSGGKRVVVVLEIVDHRSYDRWFPGRDR